MSVHSFVIEQRLEHAAYLLAGNRLNVTQTAALCGYSNMSHFSSAFKKKYGVLPKDYRP
ncbi:MAG: helix-turn-helix transcriptional regulator [Lentihominibacter sp.]